MVEREERSVMMMMMHFLGGRGWRKTPQAEGRGQGCVDVLLLSGGQQNSRGNTTGSSIEGEGRGVGVEYLLYLNFTEEGPCVH